MAAVPEIGQLVRVRERRFVVTDVRPSAIKPGPLETVREPQHVVALSSVEDDGWGDRTRRSA